MTKIHKLTIILFFIILGGQAQTLRLDSLKAILASAPQNRKKVKLLIKIANNSRPIEGIEYAQEAILLSQKLNLPKLKGYALEILSLRQRKLGNYAEAVQASFSALKIYDKLGLTKPKAALELQIGTHYANDKDFVNAKNYLKQALNSFSENKDTANIALALINLGECSRLMHEPDSAIIYFNKCLVLNKTLKKSIIEGYSLGNLGLAHFEKKQYQIAEKKILAAISILKKLNDTYSIIIYKTHLAELYSQLGQSNKAHKLFIKNLQLATTNQLREQIRDINKSLALFYENQKQFNKALNHYKQYSAYNDSLTNKDNIRKMERIKSEYLLDKKEANIQFLHRLNNSKKRLLYLGLFSVIVLLVLILFLIRSRKLLKSANAVIVKRGKEKELLLRELNHRVKNNLQMVASLFNIQARKLQGPAAKELKDARMRIEALALIHQKLYRNHLHTMVDMENYIKELIENLCFSFGKKMDVKFNLSPVKLHIDKAIPLGIIINELATNTFKYAAIEPNAQMYVELTEQSSNITLKIEDNGPGISNEIDPIQKNSLGMTLVKSLIKQLQGNFQFNGSNGCQWIIHISNKS